MFTDSNRPGISENTAEGLWALHISSPQYWAWKDWLADSLGYSRAVQSDWLTVWAQWPPTTAAGASRIAQLISEMRDELRIGKPVPRVPVPWHGKQTPVPEEYRNAIPRG